MRPAPIRPRCPACSPLPGANLGRSRKHRRGRVVFLPGRLRIPDFGLALPRPFIPGRARVRKPFASLALLFAWLCANGALLDAAQLVAWAKMFSDYRQTMSVGAAVRATFDPAKACELCVGVASARETAKQQLPGSVEQSAEKLLLALHFPAPVILENTPGAWPAVPASAAPVRTEAVPVPPPRV